MKKFLTKKSILIMVSILVIASILASCGAKQKEIVLSNNVKQDVKNQDKNSAKPIEICHLKNNGYSYEPLGWKDDKNIIAVNEDFTEEGYSDEKKEVCLYNVNIETSKTSEIRKLKNTAMLCFCKNKGLFLQNDKLKLYNTTDNSLKEIYGLSDVIKELRVNTHDNSIKPKDLVNHLYIGFVKGTDRYVYIMNYWNDMGIYKFILRMLNLNTGKVIKSQIFVNELVSKEQTVYSWAYSKANDAFYVLSYTDGTMRKFKLNMPNSLEITGSVDKSNDIIDVSADGKEFYIRGYDYSKDSNIIRIYNIENNSFKELVSNKRITTANNKCSYFEAITFDNNKHYISYGIGTSLFNKYQLDLHSTTYIAGFDGKSLSNIQKLPIRDIDKRSNYNYITFNLKGDKFIYTVKYLSFKNGKFYKYYGIDNYIYEIRK